jgi:hypothetical protein
MITPITSAYILGGYYTNLGFRLADGDNGNTLLLHDNETCAILIGKVFTKNDIREACDKHWDNCHSLLYN